MANAIASSAPAQEFRPSPLDSTPEELIARIHQGFPYPEFDNLRKSLALSIAEMARLTHIHERTLARRRKAGRLDSVESERVLRFERLFALAVKMMREEDRAIGWLKTPRSALAGKTPLEYADTEVGAREVEHLIGRVRYGVFG